MVHQNRPPGQFSPGASDTSFSDGRVCTLAGKSEAADADVVIPKRVASPGPAQLSEKKGGDYFQLAYHPFTAQGAV